MSAEVETGAGSGTAEIGDEGKFDAPLPVIGGRAIWRIGGDFWLERWSSSSRWSMKMSTVG